MDIFGIVLITWQLLSWFIAKFAWLIVAILIFSFREKILLNVLLPILLPLIKFWNLFINNFNNSYPAFSHFEIGDVENKRIDLNHEIGRSHDAFEKLLEKGYSQYLSNVMQEYVEASAKSRMFKDEVNYMIEGNIAVTNGKKKIQEVRKDFENKFGMRGMSFNMSNYQKAAEVEYKEWNERLKINLTKKT